MSGPLISTDPSSDEIRRSALRRMRTVAVSLLLFAAAVYVVTLRRDGFWGFVNAGAEASMVGAIADWFAVTALFKHPLGLPIPHTALIPKRKNDLGKGLEEFVGDNFLQEEIIRERVLGIGVARRVGDWLAVPANAERVVKEGSELAAIALGKVRDEHIEALVTEALVPRFHEEPIAPLLGGLLSEALADDLHHGLVDLMIDEIHGWLVANPETVYAVIGERAPAWAPERLNEVVVERAHRYLVRWVEEIQVNPHHRARKALDSMLVRLSQDLLDNPDTQLRAERLKDRVLDHPAVIKSAISLWKALRKALLTSLDDPAGAVRRRLLVEVEGASSRLRTDAALRERLDKMAADGAVFAVERYGAELTAVITHTIERWDGKEAARRIELHVGRDLQFIRINGTIVGGLVGVLIHAVSVGIH
ncbi:MULTISPECIES: DUF445 domain-containing protein [unclassified Nocardioides]|uniref:DUF445 domain-containing protein n=1 Tax=unclassified Nocardioides TaxID=2615069 RepID=UPI0006F6A047|nr:MULTISPECIES: DUF445 domain-containing protein [unclassified Nocardioides]KRA37572.1 hypothetical protein ASD81_02365 [Nocardioides sp. Root614]KRA91533.1 hypothetical protein ASD84_02630 [Nocardioides sp. Root682]